MNKINIFRFSGFAIIAFFTFSSFAFTATHADKKYGGTASVTVEVDFSKVGGENSGYVLALKQKGIKNGAKRVVEVSTDCNESSYAEAQKELQKEIASKTQKYEKEVSSIHYRISSCN